jgi:hypothetical protein
LVWHDAVYQAQTTAMTMTPRDLKAHKTAPKHLKEIPVFKPQKRNKLPKPFKTLGGPESNQLA